MHLKTFSIYFLVIPVLCGTLFAPGVFAQSPTCDCEATLRAWKAGGYDVSRCRCVSPNAQPV